MRDKFSFVQRASGIFFAGIALGVLIAFLFLRGSRSESNTAAITSPAAAHKDSARTDLPTDKSRAEQDKIILGNIATVPFQELYSVLSARSAKEMAELAAQFNNLPPGRETKTKITTFFAAWAHLDARAALTAAIALKTADAKDVAVAAVVRGADAIAAKSIVDVVSQLPADTLSPAQKSRSLSTALGKWSEIDPAAAAKFLDQYPTQAREFYGARIAIAQNWAGSDPTAALAWAAAQGDSREARISMAGVIGGWWDADPRAAETYVAQHADTLGIEAVMRIASQLSRQDPEHAKEWANSLSTVEARRMASTNIAMEMSNSDPKAASEWAASLPDEVRGRTLEGVISRWARSDSNAVGQWINGLNGATRDEAISAFSATMAPRDPAAALTWAATVSDPTKRSATVDRLVSGWLRRSPNDAKAWIQNSTLPDPEKTRLLALPPR